MTSTRKTHRPTYSFSVEKNYISEMTERCFLGEKRVLQPCTRLPLFRNLFYVSGTTCLRSFWIRSLLRQFDGFRIVSVAAWGKPCSILTQYTFSW